MIPNQALKAHKRAIALACSVVLSVIATISSIVAMSMQHNHRLSVFLSLIFIFCICFAISIYLIYKFMNTKKIRAEITSRSMDDFFGFFGRLPEDTVSVNESVNNTLNFCYSDLRKDSDKLKNEIGERDFMLESLYNPEIRGLVLSIRGKKRFLSKAAAVAQDWNFEVAEEILIYLHYIKTQK